MKRKLMFGEIGRIDKNTMLLLHFDDNLVDAVSKVDGISNNGYPIYFASGKFDKGISTATSSAVGSCRIQYPNVLKLYQNSKFTIECFYKHQSGTSTSIRLNSNGNISQFSINYSYNGAIHILVGKEGLSDWLAVVSTNIKLSVGIIYHIALTYDSGLCIVYVDGIALYNKTFVLSNIGVAHQTYCIVDSNDVLDEVRISDIVRYTSTFAPPTRPF